MAKKELQVSGNRNVLTVDGNRVSLDGDIQMHIVVGDMVLVLLDDASFADDDHAQDSNVIAISSNGEILWRIEPHPSENFQGEPRVNPYINIVLRDQGQKVQAYSMDGMCFDVDTESGKTSNPVFTR